MSDETPSNPLDEMVRDAAEAQRRRGLIPEVHAARKYIAPIIDRVEKKSEENRLRIKPKPAPVQRRSIRDWTDDQLNTEFQRRAARAGKEPLPGAWSITREPALHREERKHGRNALIPSKGEKLLTARIRLIRSTPDWAEKAKRINPRALAGHLGPEKRKHAEQLWVQLINDSARVWGPWWKPPGKRLFFDKPKEQPCTSAK